MNERPLRIGTRGSQLALWQAKAVASLLAASGRSAELVTIRTAGDRLQEAPLSHVGGKRLFVKEIEEALLRGDIDLAVHSAKDMPATLPAGLAVAATLTREDPRDALILPSAAEPMTLDGARTWLGPRPVIATSSVRRIAQLAGILPGATFTPIRGNVDTRLRKLDDGNAAALVLACAGMRRLGFGARITTPLPIDGCVPAPGQGIVAIEIRTDDEDARRAAERIHDPAAGISLEAERALVAALGGGCQLPLGAVALHASGRLEMHAVVASVDGGRMIRRFAEGRPEEAAALGRRLAADLTRQGASEILDAVRTAQGPVEGSY